MHGFMYFFFNVVLKLTTLLYFKASVIKTLLLSLNRKKLIGIFRMYFLYFVFQFYNSGSYSGWSDLKRKKKKQGLTV